MSGYGESQRCGNNQESSTVIIRHKPGVGQGETIVLRVENDGRETDIARFNNPAQLGEISEVVRQEIDEGNRHFIVDLRRLREINAAIVGWTIGRWTEIKNSGGVPVLVVTSDRMLTTLEVTKLNQLMHVCGSLESAKQYLERSSSEHRP